MAEALKTGGGRDAGAWWSWPSGTWSCGWSRASADPSSTCARCSAPRRRWRRSAAAPRPTRDAGVIGEPMSDPHVSEEVGADQRDARRLRAARSRGPELPAGDLPGRRRLDEALLREHARDDPRQAPRPGARSVRRRDHDDLVPRAEAPVPGALPRRAPADDARRRQHALRRVPVLLDGVPRPVHLHRGGRVPAGRQAPRLRALPGASS